jgi:hypothetical protein
LWVDGEGQILVVVDDVGDNFVESGTGSELVHLAEGFQAGLHEVSEDADLAMVDLVVGESLGDGIEVVEDGGVVFHVGESDEGFSDVGVREDGATDAGEAAVALVVVAEFSAVFGGHGAAGSAEGDATATAEGVRGHGFSLIRSG